MFHGNTHSNIIFHLRSILVKLQKETLKFVQIFQIVQKIFSISGRIHNAHTICRFSGNSKSSSWEIMCILGRSPNKHFSQSKTHETQIIKYGKCGKIENQRVLDHSQIKRLKSKRENHIYNECLTFDGTSFISTAVSNVKIFETKPNRRETCETENKTENKMQTVQSCRNRLIDVTIGFDKFFICFYAYSFCVCFVLIPELCTVTLSKGHNV